MNNLIKKRDIARLRGVLYSNIRRFFDSRGYLEVETPILSPDLIPEPTIDNFSTLFQNDFLGSRELYLLPSPEIYIKRLISEGFGSVYEISKCFRNNEQMGRQHSPEFTMLEYYTMAFSEKDSVSLTVDMLRETALPSARGASFLSSEPVVMTVRDAVLKYSGLDLDVLQDEDEFRAAAFGKLSIKIPSGEPWDDVFNRVFCTFVETAIPRDRLVFFTDYPAQINCLALRGEGDGSRYRRRWEVYAGGLELANCYAEETDPEVVRDYYRKEYDALLRSREGSGRVIPKSDAGFADIFSDFPSCSGVAMGLDRLLMLETGSSDINDVLLFPFSI